MGGPNRTVLVEHTAKKWKLVQVVGLAAILPGFLLLFLAIRSGSPGLIYAAAAVPGLGVCVALFGRAMAWWHHG